MSRHAGAFVALAAVGGVLVSGCGGHTKPKNVNLSDEYLSAAAPANAALAAFNQQVLHLPSTATAADVRGLAAPVVAAYRHLDAVLGGLSWPPAWRPHVDAFIETDQRLEADLDSPPNDTGGLGTWSAQLSSDGAAHHAAVDQLRADLGLPPSEPQTAA